ncbi:hypothetical protein JW935_16330, partial [candidate division KSB1 bacterium]|nr:hypothetical protein [candidate division KSB1 bacterium]
MHKNRALQLTGKPVLPEKPVRCFAGGLSLLYETGSIRYIKAGDTEIIRRIYSAVRDRNWGTVVPVIYDEEMDIHEDSFEIKFTAEYKQSPIFFKAAYRITGSRKGIRFTMRGAALSSFLKNRIGFCVLHPIKECAGKTCRILFPDGRKTTGKFPQTISPHQPFQDIASMRWFPAEGIEAEISFTGDVFEMEDQRNWLDASYKTYCTPLALPFPATITKGQVIEQAVELLFFGPVPNNGPRDLYFKVSGKKLKLPKIGIGESYLKIELDTESAALLGELKLNHYRTNINLSRKDWQSGVLRECSNAQKLDLKIEAALFLNTGSLSALPECIKLLKECMGEMACISVFNTEHKSTDTALLEQVMPLLRATFVGIPVGAGTDCYFTELNRQPPAMDLIDYVTFSVNPQVHAFDQLSLTETLETFRYIIESARYLARGKAIHVSPVTFKMRFHPDATGTVPQSSPEDLPFKVDTRQLSLYGAAWTLGSLKYLAESGTDFITFFETVGWRGLLQGDQDSPLPDKFPAKRNQVFPIWQIFKWLSAFDGGYVIPMISSQPLLVEGLMLTHQGRRRLLLANFTLDPQE